MNVRGNKIMLKEIIDNYKKHGEPIDLAVKDVAREFNLSEQQVSLYIERLLGEEDNTHMSFKDAYTKRRFTGK